MLRVLLLLSLWLSHVPSLVACEGCKTPSNVAGASGVAGIGASFSWSVLFMLGMLAFVMGGMISDDGPCMQAVGGTTPAGDGRISLT